jgi:hypothetical protein
MAQAVIPPTQEAEMGRTVVQEGPGKKQDPIQ